MSEVHVKGLAELQKLLDELPAKIEKNIMRGALRAGANVVKAQAQANIHSVSGELARSLRVSTNAKGGKVIAKVVAGKGFGAKGTPPKNLPLWVEYGTKAHLISVKDKPSRMTRRGLKDFAIRTINKMIARGSLVIGGNLVGPMVKHPGAAPNPFMRPALDTQAQAAVIAAGEYIKARLATQHGLDTADVMLEGDE